MWDRSIWIGGNTNLTLAWCYRKNSALKGCKLCGFLSNETRRFSNFLIRNEDHKSGPILLKIALFALRRPCLRSAICARRSVPQVLPCKPSGGNGYMCIGLNAVFFKLFSAKCTPTSNKNRCFRNILTNTQNRPLCSQIPAHLLREGKRFPCTKGGRRGRGRRIRFLKTSRFLHRPALCGGLFAVPETG